MDKIYIKNLKDLGLVLKSKPNDIAYDEILKSIQFNYKEIEHLCFWDADNYSKINVGSGLNYELVLICWEKNQQSTVHRHNCDEAFSYVLKGELTENVYQISNGNERSLMHSLTLPQESVSSISNVGNKEHQFVNSYKGRTVSLHLYIK
ncbi:MAG: hypothetical protein ACPGSO_07460 [Vicingaceae bacterium]